MGCLLSRGSGRVQLRRVFKFGRVATLLVRELRVRLYRCRVAKTGGPIALASGFTGKTDVHRCGAARRVEHGASMRYGRATSRPSLRLPPLRRRLRVPMCV